MRAKWERADLLRTAELAAFDLLIIHDKNLRHQLNLLRSRWLPTLGLSTDHDPALEKHFPLISGAELRSKPVSRVGLER